MKRVVLLLFFLLPLGTLAQRQVKRYYNEKWKPLPDSVGAFYYRVIQLDAAGRPSPFAKDYYMNGQLEFEGKFKDPFDPTSILDSINSWYRKDGTIERQIHSTDWVMNGNALYFYEDGLRVKQKIVYKEGLQESMHFFDSLGKEQTYVPASFPGGFTEMQRYLLKRTSLEESIWVQYQYRHGWVVIAFLVDEDGSLTDIKVMNSEDPLLNAAATKMIAKMPKWEPALLDGKPTKIPMSIPIRF